METNKQTQAWKRFLASSAGALLAETFTLPADVVKTRLQVQAAGQARAYTGLEDCLRRTCREEGVSALWKGLSPALLRQVSYSSLSLVLYEPFLAALGESPGFRERLLAGGCAGAVSISVFNWTEVLKTKVQSSRVRVGLREVFGEVWRSRGVLGFAAGMQANVCRTFLVNAAELGTYDHAKHVFESVFGPGFMCQLSASSVAGLASASISTPADVIKTRLMNQAGLSTLKYRGMIHALVDIPREEGLMALYQGFVPILIRKVLWTSVFFVSYEYFREHV